MVDPERIRALNQRPVRPDADYVLYWAQMNRRVDSNHALAYAVELGNELKLPVLYYEGLTCSYPHANDRLHTFILEGVPDTAKRLKPLGIGYVFYLRKRRSDPNDTLYRLARDATAIVTDDYPTFIAREHNRRVPERVDVAYHAVDSSCIVPMNLLEKREYAAYTIRPKIHKLLPHFLRPVELPRVARKWNRAIPRFHTKVDPDRIAALVASCEIDHSVPPSVSFRGGSAQAEARLDRFLKERLIRYARDRNEPSAHATSELSPYLHFGQIASLTAALAARNHAADEFLEELIVRRELAFNFTRHAADYMGFDDLPDWARKTMKAHARDRRDPAYSRAQLEAGETYDELWNATQKELLLRGKIHGYYRMYWGKKIIEWSRSYEEALEIMIDLHDRYALDGRDPNTYTNILWCFGLHDRPWPERPIFGKMRYMSLEGMKRKTDVAAYLREIDALTTTRE
ncbi:MAG: deoxyribodipyrimidine photo-lyase [Bryobacteraceae bacterium]